MKLELAASFIAAVLFHALVLFGFRLETSARPLAMSDDPSPVDVSLVEEAPAPAAAAPAPPQPAATPEPPEPQPTPDMATPPPEPEPTPDEETIPAPESTPEHPKTPPRPREHRRSMTAQPHSAPGTAAALAGGAASHGSAGRGAPGTRARYLSNPKPEYPEEAKQMREQGVVVLSVEVNTDGRASDVSVSRSSGFPQLDEAAVRAVRRWIFEPAWAAGMAVSSRVEVPVRFSLSE